VDSIGINEYELIDVLQVFSYHEISVKCENDKNSINMFIALKTLFLNNF